MDNAIVKKAIVKKKVMRERTHKLLTVQLLGAMSSAALLGCSQQSEDVQTVATLPEQDPIVTDDYHASRNTGS